MILNELRYWIFDMDGTLTVPAHDFQYARQQLGIPSDQDILGALSTRSDAERAEATRWLETWERDIAYQSQAQQDAVTLLAALRARDCRLGVVTRNTRENAVITLQAAGLSHWFADEDVLGRHDAAPKPDPAALQLLLNRWSASASEAVMVGDYIHDSRAGRAAGMHTVLVMRNGARDWQNEADWLVEDLSGLVIHPSSSLSTTDGKGQ